MPPPPSGWAHRIYTNTSPAGVRGRFFVGFSTPGPRPNWCWCTSWGPALGGYPSANSQPVIGDICSLPAAFALHCTGPSQWSKALQAIQVVTAPSLKVLQALHTHSLSHLERERRSHCRCSQKTAQKAVYRHANATAPSFAFTFGFSVGRDLGSFSLSLCLPVHFHACFFRSSARGVLFTNTTTTRKSKIPTEP